MKNATTTHDRVYTFSGTTTGGCITRNVEATAWIPTESDWYKAAYYDPIKSGAGVHGYSLQTTQSETVNGNTIDVANWAIFFDGITWIREL